MTGARTDSRVARVRATRVLAGCRTRYGRKQLVRRFAEAHLAPASKAGAPGYLRYMSMTAAMSRSSCGGLDMREMPKKRVRETRSESAPTSMPNGTGRLKS